MDDGMSTQSEQPRVAVLQDGARRRYAVPVALQPAGLLERAFIDWFSSPGSFEETAGRLASWVGLSRARQILDRSCPGLDSRRVVRNPWLSLSSELARPLFASDKRYYAWASDRTARWLLAEGFGRANVLYGFVRNIAPQLCRVASRQGLRTIGDQIIAPAAVELAEMRLQARRWPGWGDVVDDDGMRLVRRREEATWAELDHIVCMSEYVRDGLLSQGLPSCRVSVIEYPFDSTRIRPVDRSGLREKLTVGFVGAVGLRKGAPYFFEVARRFDPGRVRFVMVGAVQLNASAVAQHRGHVELIGPVPRSQVAAWLEQFDVFLFPSVCEGSAGAVMEAMASGLPVVTTYNSGSVVRDGVDGFMVRYDDINGTASRLAQLVDDRDMRLAMGRSARQRIEEFNIGRYASRLAGLCGELLARR